MECIRLGDINGGVEILIPYYMPLHLGVEAVPLDQQEELCIAVSKAYSKKSNCLFIEDFSVDFY